MITTETSVSGYALSHIRNAARHLLTLDEKNPRRIFEGEALLRRMNRYGLLAEGPNKLDCRIESQELSQPEGGEWLVYPKTENF